MNARLFQLLSSAWQRWDNWRGRRRVALATSGHMLRVFAYNYGVTTSKITRTLRAVPLYEMANASKRDRLLIVGPRNVHELLIAWWHGFAWRNITGIDLYSNNPKILVRDARNTGFPDASFDVIVSSATFSYFEDIDAALDELVRVLAPGGRMIFSATYDPLSSWPGNHLYDDEWCLALSKRGVPVTSSSIVHKISAQNHPVEIATYHSVKG